MLLSSLNFWLSTLLKIICSSSINFDVLAIRCGSTWSFISSWWNLLFLSIFWTLIYGAILLFFENSWSLEILLLTWVATIQRMHNDCHTRSKFRIFLFQKLDYFLSFLTDSTYYYWFLHIVFNISDSLPLFRNVSTAAATSRSVWLR